MAPRRRRRPKRRRRPRRPYFGILGRVQKQLGTALPAVSKIRMRYTEAIALTSATGIMHSAAFSCNSIFDPNRSGIGHSTYGHSQWAQLYNHYTVSASKILVQLGENGNTSVPVAAGIYTDDTATISTLAYSTLIEAGRGVHKFVSGRAEVSANMKLKWNAKKFFNITDIKDNTSRVGAIFAANPTEEAFFIVYLQSVDSASQSGEFDTIVTIDYDVILSEPKELTAS